MTILENGGRKLRHPKLEKRKPKHRGGEKGQSIVEFAMVVTIFFAIVFGVFDFGIAAYTYHYVSNSAREAARWAIVHGQDSSSPATATDVENYVKDAGRLPPGINPANMTVTTEWPGDATNPDCTAGSKKHGCPVKVTVLYNYDFLLPFITSPALQIQSSSQMVIAH